VGSSGGAGRNPRSRPLPSFVVPAGISTKYVSFPTGIEKTVYDGCENAGGGARGATGGAAGAGAGGAGKGAGGAGGGAGAGSAGAAPAGGAPTTAANGAGAGATAGPSGGARAGEDPDEAAAAVPGTGSTSVASSPTCRYFSVRATAFSTSTSFSPILTPSWRS